MWLSGAWVILERAQNETLHCPNNSNHPMLGSMGIYRCFTWLGGITMRQETIEIFKFDELSDKAKDKAREWYRTNIDFSWSDESLDSIKVFCEHFNITLKSYSVAPYENPDYSVELLNSNFRGLKLKDFSRDNMPTGYFLDYTLWMTFFDEFKATGCAKKAFDSALRRVLLDGVMTWKANYQMNTLTNI